MRGGGRKTVSPRARKSPDSPKSRRAPQPGGAAAGKLRAAQGLALPPKVALLAAGGVFAIGIVLALGTGGRGERLGAAIGQSLADKTTGFGLTVAHIEIEGASPAGEAALRQALAPAMGQAILGLDLTAVRDGAEEIGWVEKASVVRLLPDTVLVKVQERGALAVWQKDRRLVVIDGEGRVIREANAAAFPELPLVVGPGADQAAAGIIQAINSRPRLRSRVEALVRVDGRRWDIRLKDGAIIMLPAVEEESALIELDLLDRRDRVLEAGLERIDLREPGAAGFRQREAARPPLVGVSEG